MRKRPKITVRRVVGALLIAATFAIVVAVMYQQGGVESLLALLIVIAICVLGGVGAWLLLN